MYLSTTYPLPLQTLEVLKSFRVYNRGVLHPWYTTRIAHRLLIALLLAALLAESCIAVSPDPKRTPVPQSSPSGLPSLAPTEARQTAAPEAAPVISNIQLSAASVARYTKLEITFQLATIATNLQLPYDARPPAGVQPGVGVSVEAQFSPDGWRTIYRQPAFYYQAFQDERRGSREWIYPTDQYAWKVRFSPDRTGNWQVKLAAEDAGGRRETQPVAFSVTPSDSKGFLRVSKADPRYFEFQDGSYFPGLGYNLNYAQISWTNPVLDNEANFQLMQQNGIQFVRMWLSQWGIYGPSWNPWNSIDGELHGQYIPFSGLTVKEAYPGSETSMRIDSQANACMFLGWGKPAPAAKPNTRYRVRVRYRTDNLGGPRAAGSPYGLVVKTGGWLENCGEPGAGTAVSAYQPQNTANWQVLEGAQTTGSASFLPNFYLSVENATQGVAYIDYVWVEEDLGGGQYGTNILPKPWMAHHLYFEQRNSYAFDRVLELAERYDVYLRPVLMEKNDWILNRIDFDGAAIPADPLCNDDNPGNDPPRCPNNRWFYGNGRSMTRVRWMQQAWWRYAQARWGYSPNIHSWELLNEGDPNSVQHYQLADEFGKYMHQWAPNAHMVSTSFWHSFPKDAFWSNPNYANVDFADIHQYIQENSLVFRDTALMASNLSQQIGALTPGGPGKPVVRGETGLLSGSADSASALVQRDTRGVWLHNYLWAQINAGGVIESYWWVEPHMLLRNANGVVYDHRSKYGIFYRFLKDLPLNNGSYRDAAAQVSTPQLRALGQKDAANGRAHLWIQNVDSTWYNAINGIAAPPVSGTVRLSGFRAGQSYRVSWWDPYQSDPARQVTGSQVLSADASGNITLTVSGLTSDTAVQIAPASGSVPIGDKKVFAPLVTAHP